MNLTDFKNNILPIKNKLFRFALRIVNDPAEAEDVVQEVFIKFWKYLEKGETVDNPEAWCMRATRNQAIDKLRSKHKRVESLDEKYDQKDKSASPFQLASMKDTMQYIKSFINQLPEKQKLVMHLRDIEGHTYQEIADALELPLGQVKVNLFRARQTIRTKLLKSKIVELG
jgi:RNA polymerase sigma-70 factor (ECF subfamily)